MDDIYIVEEGDTLESVAKKINVSIYDIIRRNGLEEIFELRPGMQLQIPMDSNSAFIFYTVQPGDRFFMGKTVKPLLKFKAFWRKMSFCVV